MADKKISALPAATTPLAGTEVLPIVQGGTTDQVSVANLTAARAVSGASFNVTGSTPPTNGIYLPAANSVGIATNGSVQCTVDATGNFGLGTSGQPDKLFVYANTASSVLFVRNDGAGPLQTWATFGTTRMQLSAAGNLTVNTGNLVVGTAGKGITTGSATALGFGVNNSTTDMTLDASGNLLVGNTTQLLFVNKELNVNAASGSAGFALATGGTARLYMTAGSTNVNITTKGAIPLLLGTDETERLRVDGSTGNVGIGGAPAATAILDVQSTTKGVRFPNMTTTQKNAITPSAGTVIFDTTLSKLCVYSGAAWQTITSV